MYSISLDVYALDFTADNNTIMCSTIRNTLVDFRLILKKLKICSRFSMVELDEHVVHTILNPVHILQCSVRRRELERKRSSGTVLNN